MHTDISTDTVPEAERFDFWRETCCEPIGLMPERDGDTAPFHARITRVTVGSLFHIQYKQVTACRVSRTAHEVARYPRQCCTVYREFSAGAWFDRAGRDFTTTTGDIVIADLDQPFVTRPLAANYAHDVWMIPKAMLAPFLPASGRPLLQKLRPIHGVEQLLAGYLDVLAQQIVNMAPAALDRVTDNLCRLIGIACGMAADEHHDAVHDARLMQAKQYVERHLADPTLSPASIAASLGISVRFLHVLFEPAGTSVARHILRLRLEECRWMLLREVNRPVTDIAFAWGFNSLSGFYRAFQAAFGVSPTDLRAAAHHSPPT